MKNRSLQAGKLSFAEGGRMIRNIILNEQQKKIVEMDVSGTLLVRGVAGCGKSTVAVKRALAIPVLLSKRKSSDGQTNLFSPEPLSIAIFTYNLVLKNFLTSMIRESLQSEYMTQQKNSNILLNSADFENVEISVETIYSHAWKYIKGHGFLLMNEPEFIKTVKDIIKTGHLSKSLSNRDVSFFCDEFKWFKGMRVRDLDEYLKIIRRGREGRLGAEDRKIIWELYGRFKNYQKTSKKILYEDFPNLALKFIEKGEDPSDSKLHLFDAIIIDEAQDLSRASLKFLSYLAKPNLASVTILSDAAQAIYQNGITWKDAGFKVHAGRSIELRTNFRSNPAISRVARCIAGRITDRDDLIDISVNGQGNPQTSLPEILICPDPETEMQLLVHLIRGIISDHGSSSIAVLYKLKSMKTGYISTLNYADIPCIDLNAGKESPISINDGVYVSTMHAAKGLEFDHVILADVNESIFRSFDVSDSEIGNKNRRLLYTAMTRARQSLHILTSDRDYALILNDIEPDLADIRSISL